MKNNVLYILALVIVVALVTVGCTSAPTTPTQTTTPDSQAVVKETIKIGMIASLTGDNAMLGQPPKNALMMLSKELSTKDLKYNYEFIYEDDRLDNKLSASAAQKLINIDKVDAIISFTSGTGNVVNPMAENSKVLHCGIASDGNIANGQYNFIHWTQPSEEGRVYVKKLQDEGMKKVSAFLLNHQGTEAIMKGFEDNIPGSNVELVNTYKYNFGDTDFKNTLLKIEQDNPDTILVLAIAPELDLFVKQMRELNIDIPLTSIEVFEYSETPELFNGYWYVQAADPTGDFNKLYQSNYGEFAKPGAGNAYDCAGMIIDSFESFETKPTTAQVAAKMQSITNYDGAMGSLNVNAEGVVHSEAVVKMVQDGKFITLG